MTHYVVRLREDQTSKGTPNTVYIQALRVEVTAQSYVFRMGPGDNQVVAAFPIDVVIGFWPKAQSTDS